MKIAGGKTVVDLFPATPIGKAPQSPGVFDVERRVPWLLANGNPLRRLDAAWVNARQRCSLGCKWLFHESYSYGFGLWCREDLDHPGAVFLLVTRVQVAVVSRPVLPHFPEHFQPAMARAAPRVTPPATTRCWVAIPARASPSADRCSGTGRLSCSPANPAPMRASAGGWRSWSRAAVGPLETAGPGPVQPLGTPSVSLGQRRTPDRHGRRLDEVHWCERIVPDGTGAVQMRPDAGRTRLVPVSASVTLAA